MAKGSRRWSVLPTCCHLRASMEEIHYFDKLMFGKTFTSARADGRSDEFGGTSCTASFRNTPPPPTPSPAGI